MPRRKSKETSEERGLREARQYANKLLAGAGSHQDYSDLTNTLLVGMQYGDDAIVYEPAVKQAQRIINGR